MAELPYSYANFGLLREIAFVILISCAQLFTQACLAQTIVAVDTIGDFFDITSPGVLSWFTASFSLTVGTFILPAGRWGDVYGTRRLFIIGYGWFAIASLITGFAAYCSSAILFHVFRALQGLGPAILMPNGLALLGRTYPNGTSRKNMVFCIFGASAPVGFVLGALMMSVFSEFVWWPWSFWWMAASLAVCFVACIIVIPRELDIVKRFDFHASDGHLAPSKFMQIILELDVAGTILGVGGLVLINVGLNQAPSVGWKTSPGDTIVLLIIGVLLFVAFVFCELHSLTRFPIVPFRDLSANTAMVFACVALGWSSFGIWMYYYWLFSLNLRHHSALVTTATQAPTAVAGACAALLTGYLLGIMSPRKVILCAMVFFTIGNVLMGTTPVDQSYWFQSFWSVIVTPFGMDMSFPSGTIILSDSMPHHYQGLAASLIGTVVNYSIALGLGIAGSVEENRDPDATKLLVGYRAAWYVAMGLSGFGIVIGIIFAAAGHEDSEDEIYETVSHHHQYEHEQEEKEHAERAAAAAAKAEESADVEKGAAYKRDIHI
ncbi:YOR378W-like protein [Limtongia smithiae]|uniref:YOR378W-like protein n=1 Tax=Limtongia smithiae TaxID=1125753 RepID=UPI0034CDE1D4